MYWNAELSLLEEFSFSRLKAICCTTAQQREHCNSFARNAHHARRIHTGAEHSHTTQGIQNQAFVLRSFFLLKEMSPSVVWAFALWLRVHVTATCVDEDSDTCSQLEADGSLTTLAACTSVEIVIACCGCGGGTPMPTPIPTGSPTSSPTSVPTPFSAGSPTSSPTSVPTPFPTGSATPSPTSVLRPSPTPSDELSGHQHRKVSFLLVVLTRVAGMAVCFVFLQKAGHGGNWLRPSVVASCDSQMLYHKKLDSHTVWGPTHEARHDTP